MAMDPYARVFRPDFQANMEQPAWQPMGDSQQGDQAAQATGSFVDLLKKRMAGGGAAAGGSKGGAMPSMEGMAGGGGGMQSL